MMHFPLGRALGSESHGGVNFWKIIQVLGVFFWAVMTGLLIRDTYFPEESRFAEVPPNFVLDLFLKHRDVPNTLLLYKEDKKLGHALIGVRALTAAPGQTTNYDFQGSGQIEGEAFGKKEHQMTWRLTSELDSAKQWRKLSLQMIWQTTDPSAGPDQSLVANIAWSEGAGEPVFEVRQGGRVNMDLAKATSLLDGGAFPLLNLLGSSRGSGFSSGLAQLKAREGLMLLAGKRRKCYVLQMNIMGMYEMNTVFTEAGELARVDLPQDWRLLEPMIHGLGGHVVP
jgi:hypothetical protein